MLLNAGYSLGAALARLAQRGHGSAARDLGVVVNRVRQGLSETEALREWAEIARVDAVDRLVRVLSLHAESSDLGRLVIRRSAPGSPGSPAADDRIDRTASPTGLGARDGGHPGARRDFPGRAVLGRPPAVRQRLIEKDRPSFVLRLGVQSWASSSAATATSASTAAGRAAVPAGIDGNWPSDSYRLMSRGSM